ncbi:unnamed protein product [Calypogeia fissa]
MACDIPALFLDGPPGDSAKNFVKEAIRQHSWTESCGRIGSWSFPNLRAESGLELRGGDTLPYEERNTIDLSRCRRPSEGKVTTPDDAGSKNPVWLKLYRISIYGQDLTLEGRATTSPVRYARQVAESLLMAHPAGE